jgi:hypothetical protein
MHDVLNAHHCLDAIYSHSMTCFPFCGLLNCFVQRGLLLCSNSKPRYLSICQTGGMDGTVAPGSLHGKTLTPQCALHVKWIAIKHCFLPQSALSGPPFKPCFLKSTDGTEQRYFKLHLPRIKQLVELHGGSMHITSRPGVGTTVSLALPVYDATLHASSGSERKWQKGEPAKQVGDPQEKGSGRFASCSKLHSQDS